MKRLARPQLLAVARLVKQVGVAFAKGVVHFGHDGAQTAVHAVAVPETDRLEAVAQHPRVALVDNRKRI